MRARVLWALLTCLSALPSARGEPSVESAEPGGRPEGEFYAEYATEDLDGDPGVVALSGEIVVVRGDFELRVPDGGVVLWVDPEAWRKFRRGAADLAAPAAEGEEGKDGGGEDEAAPRTAEQILGPIIRELYAEGGVTLRRGRETVRAQRLFYDFARNRAVVVNAEVLLDYEDERRSVRTPIIVRAERLYQEVEGELHAGPARATTSLFAKPQYELTVDEVTVRRADVGYDIHAAGNVLRAGDVPLLWLPSLGANSTTGIEPLKDLRVGASSRFGVFGEIGFGGSVRFGEDPTAKPDAEWRLTPVYRSRRGPGVGGEVDYGGGEDLRGAVEAFYQHDGASEDHLRETEVPRTDRGRARWQHRQTLAEDVLGGRLTGRGEVSWLSDPGYLIEYETSEAQQGKAQETFAYLDLAGDHLAASILGDFELNRWQTSTEYAPRVALDAFGVPAARDLLGTGVDLVFAGEAEAARVERYYAREDHTRGIATDRYQGRGSVSLPFTAGWLRLNPEAGAGVTGYAGGQDLTRGDFFTALRAGTDLWRVWPDVRSDLFDLDGVRHVLDLSAGYSERYCVTTGSEDVFVQDPLDLLDEVSAVDFRVRNRIETKRRGEVVEFADLELRLLGLTDGHEARPAPFSLREEWGLGMSALLLTEEEKLRYLERDSGAAWGTGGLRMRLREDLSLIGDLWYDFATHRVETFSEGLRYEASSSLAFFLGHRAIAGDSSIVTGWVELRVGDRWEVRLYQQTDLRDDGGLGTGVAFRRLFPDLMIEFRLEWSDTRDEVSFSMGIEPRLWYEADRTRRAAEADTLDYRGMRRTK